MKIVDMHCDTIERLLGLKRAGETKENLRQNEGHLDLLRMKKSGYFLQNFAMFVNLKKIHNPWDEVCALYELYEQELAQNRDIIGPVYSFADIAQNEQNGRMSALLTVEEGAVCQGEIGKLRRLYEMGVRMMTLTWNYPNELGEPAVNSTGGGLTEVGFSFVSEMEKLGMIIDVSHLSDAGFYDVLRVSHKPFVASHSNARSICQTARNLTDDMIQKLAERGGVMGLNFYKDFLEKDFLEKDIPEKDLSYMGLDSMVRHARHITNLGGVEVLGIGSDFDGITTNEALPGAQNMELLWNALKKSGYSEKELDKIFAGNVLRLYEEIL